MSYFNSGNLITTIERKFISIKSKLEIFLADIGIKSYSSIPISSKKGDNIVTLSKKTRWYKGLSFVEVLDECKIQENEKSESIRFPVQDIYKMGDKRIIVGRIESGKIKSGTKLIFLPSNESVSVKTLEVWPKAKKEYEIGDCIGITLSEQIFVDKGNMASDIKTPPKLTNRFESRMFWLSKKKISFNKKY